MKAYTQAEMNKALDNLRARTAGLEGQSLRDELTRFINEMPVSLDGNPTILWAGFRSVADNIANTENNIRILNKTLVNDILLSDDFENLIAKSFGVDIDTYRSAPRDSALGKLKTDFVFESPTTSPKWKN